MSCRLRYPRILLDRDRTQRQLPLEQQWRSGEGLQAVGEPSPGPLAAFITGGFVLAAGANVPAVAKVAAPSVISSIVRLMFMAGSPATADLPDFSGIALRVGILGFGALHPVVLPWYYAPVALSACAVIVFWRKATGFDDWAEKSGGIGRGLTSLANLAAAGRGAFGGALSTPYVRVGVSCTMPLLIGCLALAGRVWVGAGAVPRSLPKPDRAPERGGSQ